MTLTDQTQPNRIPPSVKQSGRRPPRTLSEWLRIVGAAGFVIVTLMLSVVAFLVVRDLTASWTGLGLNPFQASGVGGQATVPAGMTPTAPAPVVTPAEWQGAERVNVLLMGLDYRDWIAGEGPARTDSMMLVSLDPLTKHAGMIYIPRDLWVEIPGFGYNRINTAYPSGEGNRLPGGGPALAMRTVESVVGVPIQYYAVIDFTVFEKLIDEIGGIDVLVTERIKICPISRTCVWLEPKAHHLNGANTLAYARVRKGAGDDFGRGQRQQQVAMAVLDRVTSLNMVPTLLAKAPALYQQLSSSVNTNLAFDQIISLGWLAVQTPKANFERGVIAPPDMVGYATRPDGAQVLRPVPDQIRILRDTLFIQFNGIGP
jgi:LCP family protein required for cell wall assembly